jgi:hypothetical protein
MNIPIMKIPIMILQEESKGIECWTNLSKSPRSVFITSGFTGKDKSLP